MIYNHTKHDFKDESELYYYPDRTEFCNKIAYSQWTMDEMKSGEAWKHLRKGMIKADVENT